MPAAGKVEARTQLQEKKRKANSDMLEVLIHIFNVQWYLSMKLAWTSCLVAVFYAPARCDIPDSLRSESEEE